MLTFGDDLKQGRGKGGENVIFFSPQGLADAIVLLADGVSVCCCGLELPLSWSCPVGAAGTAQCSFGSWAVVSGAGRRAWLGQLWKLSSQVT